MEPGRERVPGCRTGRGLGSVCRLRRGLISAGSAARVAMAVESMRTSGVLLVRMMGLGGEVEMFRSLVLLFLLVFITMVRGEGAGGEMYRVQRVPCAGGLTVGVSPENATLEASRVILTSVVC